MTPGPAFSVDGTFERHLRLPFTAAPEVLEDAVRTLVRLGAGLGRDGVAAPDAAALAV